MYPFLSERHTEKANKGEGGLEAEFKPYAMSRMFPEERRKRENKINMR